MVLCAGVMDHFAARPLSGSTAVVGLLHHQRPPTKSQRAVPNISQSHRCPSVAGLSSQRLAGTGQTVFPTIPRCRINFFETQHKQQGRSLQLWGHRQSNHQMMLSINLTCRPRFIIPTSLDSPQEAHCKLREHFTFGFGSPCSFSSSLPFSLLLFLLLLVSNSRPGWAESWGGGGRGCRCPSRMVILRSKNRQPRRTEVSHSSFPGFLVSDGVLSPPSSFNVSHLHASYLPSARLNQST